METDPEKNETNNESEADIPDKRTYFKLSNSELEAAINQARDLMSRSGSKTPLWNTLEDHFLQLLEIQRGRAAMIISVESPEPEKEN